MDYAFFDKAASVFPDECFSCPPDLGVILGSGWGEALVKDAVIQRIPYADIPGVGKSTVVGHAGEFVLYEKDGGVQLYVPSQELSHTLMKDASMLCAGDGMALLYDGADYWLVRLEYGYAEE